ncbi:hypothetical protein EDD36DRAFT_326278 [Exophiala viscosa]|uniref:Uncharacterized protein n=1 Tax=Exophiala viscosa TaxID=2486360 RepID=A0AAN6DS18_9EURO|nr:hypothetical protein EDD36DRAFT_326278 [Exophiala viscosa]
MTDRTQDTTKGVLGDVKSALKGIKGAGDTIRGTVNESVDTAFDDKQGQVENRAVKEKGEADVNAADQRLSGGNNTGLKTGGVSGTTTTTTGGTTTGAGAHSGGVGNLRSDVPQTGLGDEPGSTTQRY